MLTVKVRNVEGRTGRAVPNQFMIETQDGKYFQSYGSVIVFWPRGGGKIQLDKDTWDYSVTTGKYRNKVLREEKRETERKIKNGVYELVELN